MDKKTKGIHLGIIPDGSRRWAKINGIKNYDGMRSGKVMEDIVTHVFEKCPEIDELSLWAMSTENLKRAEKDKRLVENLIEGEMRKLLRRLIEMREEKVKVNVVGSKLSEIPKDIMKLAEELMDMTKDNDGKTLNICIGYGGREEIINAVMGITKWMRKNPTIARLHEGMFERHLLVPKPLDMVIRTGGEKRLSGFMLYQIEYAELFFTETLWPDFTVKEFDGIMKEFSERTRRFGR